MAAGEAGSEDSSLCNCVGELFGVGAVGGGAYWMHEPANGDVGDPAELPPLWWFSVCLLRDRASQ